MPYFLGTVGGVMGNGDPRRLPSVKLDLPALAPRVLSTNLGEKADAERLLDGAETSIGVLSARATSSETLAFAEP